MMDAIFHVSEHIIVFYHGTTSRKQGYISYRYKDVPHLQRNPAAWYVFICPFAIINGFFNARSRSKAKISMYVSWPVKKKCTIYGGID
jgi:hypothetical protein